MFNKHIVKGGLADRFSTLNIKDKSSFKNSLFHKTTIDNVGVRVLIHTRRHLGEGFRKFSAKTNDKI